MGAGKSTVGIALANAMQWQFIDTDAVVTELEKMPVTEIFKQKGARYFARQERLCVAKICERPKQIISLGGGTLLDSKICRMIKKEGFLMYLKVPEAILLKRLEREIGNYPLLSETEGGGGIGFKMHKLLAEREPFYEKTASYVVHFHGQTVPNLVEEILVHVRPLLLQQKT